MEDHSPHPARRRRAGPAPHFGREEEERPDRNSENQWGDGEEGGVKCVMQVVGG